MNRSVFRGAFGAAVLALATSRGVAHAVLEHAEARPNSSYRAVIQIMHGCKGSPTVAVKVSVPEGAIGARPLVKPGWTIATTRGPYARSYRLGHGAIAEGVREITWTGGTIPDDQFDEFVFTVRLAGDLQPGTTLYFPVVQTCTDATVAWAQIPADGQDPHALADPAPGLHMLAAASARDDIAAAAIKVGALTIEQPWLRATLPGAKVAGGYLTITNSGATSDRLVSASIPGAASGEVHEMKLDGEIMRMRPVDGGLEVGPGQSVELKPGGFHVMFLDLAAPLKDGENVRGSVTFAKAGTVPVTFHVGGYGAQAPADEHIH